MGATDTRGQRQALNNAQTAFNQYQTDYANWQNEYNQFRDQADQAWTRDFGGSAAEFKQKANQAGIQQANQQLDQAARGATNQAQLASRGAGLSKGQAAMNAAGAANQTFQQNFMPAVQQGIQNYGNAVNMNQQFHNQGMGNALQGQGMASGGRSGAIGTQANVGASQMSQRDRNMSTIGTVGGMAAGAGMALSDGDAKEDIMATDNSWQDDIMSRLMALSDERTKEPIDEPVDLLAEVAENINNYTYHYKPGVGEDPSVEHSGPMAQELLQVDGYRACVFEDENGLLQVDTGRLSMVNAGMIADLSKRVIFLEDFIQSVMGGLEPPEAMPDVMPEQMPPDVE